MLHQELVLLGLLMDGPKHGYQIKKSIERIKGVFASIDTNSIYYPLKMLELKGLVTKKIVKEGKRPEKYVYSITPKGKRRFYKLLNDNFLLIQRPFINVDLSFYFFPYVDKELAKRRLKIRLRGLKRVKKWLEERKSESNLPEHLILILEHNLELVEAEIKFTSRLLNTFL